jgi:hypothetical protein
VQQPAPIAPRIKPIERPNRHSTEYAVPRSRLSSNTPDGDHRPTRSGGTSRQYGQAIGYALNHRDELRRFTDDGRLEIDNNTAERTLRLCAISRKNWLFVGSDQGGKTAAICFSILAGAKRHRIEPLAYVRALLTALSLNEVDLWTLLPDVWIAAHPEYYLIYRREDAEAAAMARRRRRERRPAQAREHSRSP